MFEKIATTFDIILYPFQVFLSVLHKVTVTPFVLFFKTVGLAVVLINTVFLMTLRLVFYIALGIALLFIFHGIIT